MARKRSEFSSGPRRRRWIVVAGTLSRLYKKVEIRFLILKSSLSTSLDERTFLKKKKKKKAHSNPDLFSISPNEHDNAKGSQCLKVKNT